MPDLLQEKIVDILEKARETDYGPLETADWILEIVTLALNHVGIDCRGLNLSELEAPEMAV